MITKPNDYDLIVYEPPDRYTSNMNLLIFDAHVSSGDGRQVKPLSEKLLDITGWDVVIRAPNTSEGKLEDIEMSVYLTLEDAKALRDYLNYALRENAIVPEGE